MLKDWQAFQGLAKAFAEGDVCLTVAGVAGAARPLVVADLLHAHPRAAVVVVRSMTDAHRMTQDLKFFGAPVLEFPEREPRLWRGGHHREADAARAGVAHVLDFAPADAPVLLEAPGLLDETSEEAPGRRPLREVIGGRPRVELELVSGTAAEHALDTQEVPRFGGRFADLTAALARWRVEGFTVRLVVADELQAEHLRQILRDHDVGALVAPGIDAPEPLAIVLG